MLQDNYLEASIIAQNIYLEKVEKQMFMNKNLSYLVELFHIGSTHTIENPNSNDTYFIHLKSLSSLPNLLSKHVFCFG